MFYPAEARECRSMAEAMLQANQGIASSAAMRTGKTATKKKWLGGIVPHAGWICSGAIAGQTIGTLARLRSERQPRQSENVIVVVFGAVHSPLRLEYAALDAHERWHVPAGDSDVPQELNRKLTESSALLFAIDERFHQREHAVEVELPLIQAAWPNASVLPVEVPAADQAIDIGRRTAELVANAGFDAVYLASSDLTHYGPNYDFTPAGTGEQAMRWAKENDQRLLDVITDFAVERVVPDVRENLNACGAGAIAAMMSACRQMGASEARVLRHASSYETLAEAGYPQEPVNAVGYASVIVG